MAERRPWRCAGCLAFNGAGDAVCRSCGPAAGHIDDEEDDEYLQILELEYQLLRLKSLLPVECSCIDDGDDNDSDMDSARFADVPNDFANISNEHVPIAASEHAVGVQDPVGLWDPGGFTADDNVEHSLCRRQTELKHGRFSTPATTGCITPERLDLLPGSLSPAMGIADVPNGFANISNEHVPIVASEHAVGVQDPVGLWDPGGFTVDDNVEHSPCRRQTELKQGKSSLPTTGCITPECVGKLLGYLSPAMGIKFANVPHGFASISNEHVPIAAFEHAVGVQDPMGLWDPGGFAADDIVEHSKCRHQKELKHGKSSLLATTGCITPERVGTLPGSLYPAMGIKFADVPHGFTNISNEHVPIAVLEHAVGVQGPLGLWDPGGFTVDDIVEHSQCRRQTVLKHGKSSLPATTGCITPEGVGKLPGSLSPAMGIKLANVPHGFANISNDHVPIAAFEHAVGVQDPLGLWDPGGLMVDDGIGKHKVLEVVLIGGSTRTPKHEVRASAASHCDNVEHFERRRTL